jgi:hypothetical protein
VEKIRRKEKKVKEKGKKKKNDKRRDWKSKRWKLKTPYQKESEGKDSVSEESQHAALFLGQKVESHRYSQHSAKGPSKDNSKGEHQYCAELPSVHPCGEAKHHKVHTKSAGQKSLRAN